MDETKVPTYPLVNLIPTHPTVDNEKYPKVGDSNPVVKLGVVDVEKGVILGSMSWPAGNQIFAVEALPVSVTIGFPFGPGSAAKGKKRIELFFRGKGA